MRREIDATRETPISGLGRASQPDAREGQAGLLGVAEGSVRPMPPSQSWRTFLRNHALQISLRYKCFVNISRRWLIPLTQVALDVVCREVCRVWSPGRTPRWPGRARFPNSRRHFLTKRAVLPSCSNDAGRTVSSALAAANAARRCLDCGRQTSITAGTDASLQAAADGMVLGRASHGDAF